MTDSADHAPLTYRDLEAFIVRGANPHGPLRIGLEAEKLGVDGDGRPPPYSGPRGIEQLLETLAAGRPGAAPYQAQRDDGHIIALRRADEAITVEPGGQFEHSGPPGPSVGAALASLDRHLAEVVPAARELGITFIHGGFRPWGRLDDIEWLPKRRYGIMREYLPTRGGRAHDMMKRTATVQANLDYRDADDACDRQRTAAAVTSVVTAMFASSPIKEGRPTGLVSERAAVWLDTDPDRCGLLPFVFDPGYRLRDYVEWALDVPMFFVVRDGAYRPARGTTFRALLRGAWPGVTATAADWELHLSTLFPEVRLKRTIEVRGADAPPRELVGGLAALWRGVLDDPSARAAAWALVADVDVPERERVRREVPRAGLRARLGGRPLAELAVDLVAIARAGLSVLPDGAADARFLDPVEALAREGRCPADAMLDDFRALGGDPVALCRRWALGAP